MSAFAQNETRRALSERGSQSMPTHRLDSMVHREGNVGYEKQTFEFNANGNLTEVITYAWVSNAWRLIFRDAFTYHPDGNLASHSHYERNTPGGTAWIGIERREFEYDANGNVILNIRSAWIGNAWVRQSRDKMAFDADGNQTMHANYWWWNNVWDGFFKWEEEFDHHGNVASHTAFSYAGGGVWAEMSRNEYRNEYEYDSDGRVVEFYAYLIVGAGEYRLVRRTYFDYDAAGNMVEKIAYRWNNWIDAWQGDVKIERGYDAVGNRILQILHNYDAWGGAGWEIRERIETTFENGGRTVVTYSWCWDKLSLMETERFVYDTHGNTIIIDRKQVVFGLQQGIRTRLVHDVNVLHTGVISPVILALRCMTEVTSVIHKPTAKIIYAWNYTASVWAATGGRIDFYYYEMEDGTTDIPNRPEVSIAVFPNPAADSFVISGITENTLVTVTDLSGRTVLQQIVAPNESVSVSHLPQGIYFVRVNETVVRVIKQ